MLLWVEKERRNAVRTRMDGLATKMRGTPTPPAARSPSIHGSTDKGLMSSAHHTLGVQKPSGDSNTEDSPSGAQGGNWSWTPVSTQADAQDLADRRKNNLAAKKLDKCPMCSQVHTYERTWSSTQPPVKAMMISTHFVSCPKFLLLSPDQKVAAILGHAGCLLCTSWDHSVHKYPGGKSIKDPKCTTLINGSACGGRHGRWFHDQRSTATSGGVVAHDTEQGLGLYEVFRARVHSPQANAGTDQKEVPLATVMIDPGRTQTSYPMTMPE